MTRRRCAISVDLDEIPHYFAIHGLSQPEGEVRHLAYEIALPRIADWAQQRDIPLTLFAVGADLTAGNAERLRRLKQAGHEIANHSQDHRYDLVRLERAAQLEQVARGIEAITAATGQPPLGFRAPGYGVTDALFSVLRELGVSYDSSVFPCPAYYAAKAAKLLSLRLQGRPSRAVLHAPSVLLAPRAPYRVGEHYFQRGNGIVELPIQVTPRARLPVIGTTLTLLGPERSRSLVRGLCAEPFVNLELHAIDFLSASDGLQMLESHQPDLKVPLERKLDALESTVELLARADFAYVRLAEAARSV